MTLTEKDRTFLETLRELMQSHDLTVEMKMVQPRRMVLRGNYGDKIHKSFGISRQGVRWRFGRLFNDLYPRAFELILFVEKSFGTGLRAHAIELSKERFWARQMASRNGLASASCLVGSWCDSSDDHDRLHQKEDSSRDPNDQD